MSKASAWQGFLPPRSIIMTRRKAPQKAARATVPESIESQAAPSLDSLQRVEAELENCTRCKLCGSGRHQILAGEGPPRARLMCIEGAPAESNQGRPLTGPAGQLFEKMLEAIGLRRADVFITTVVKCSPPENRDPQPDEIAVCSPFLQRQIDLIRPEVILALGTVPAQTLLRTEASLSELRGRFHPYACGTASSATHPIQVLPSFHPSHLLQNPGAKKDAWADLQRVARELKLQLPNAVKPQNPSSS